MNEYHTSGPYVGMRKSADHIRRENDQRNVEITRNVESAQEAMNCCSAVLTCGGNYGKAAMVNGITAIAGYALANNASEITKDPDGNGALYGISITLAVLTTLSGLYNAARYLCNKCCSTNVNEATASNPTVGARQHV